MDEAVRHQRYLSRFHTVIDYIYDHLDEPLDLNSLADLVHMSPYHWHRIYQSAYGESLKATVKRLRLHRAAGQLASSTMAVEAIARQSGYTSLQSFTRAFSQEYGQPPATYRRAGSHTRFRLDSHLPEAAGDNETHQVNIVTRDPIRVVGLDHIGDYMNIGQAFEKLAGWMALNQLFTPQMASFGIYLDDPTRTPSAELRSFACATAPGINDSLIAEPYRLAEIDGGDYAVLRFKGPYANLDKAYFWLYGKWLPFSGRDIANKPVVEQYLNNPREVAPNDLLTDIFLPLR